ncbi:cobalt-precorrin-7 (C(5))-methyltransferase [Stygiolobus caldivivus]|uniref:Cobalt-precorrin-7 (C(5))-methyltransferase n=1 Tax=Stygiolobus caldivivus TaxID=2824673 RepID=A0A8D5ZJR3_9CREN|nr:cobalt-precorrin-7 (C(5))-methyltransferase [Stygiolobus caldivivus]BCU70891.1 cobalt-precorrin-7 (C(5))-methyltransferase [Stygiolobus caldivivus]
MIYLVGVGSGDPELITVKAVNTLKSCKVIAGWRSVIDRFDFIKTDSSKEIVYLNYKEQEKQIPELVKRSKTIDIAILFHGDPMVSDYQFLDRIKKECAKVGVRYVILSGISSVLRALAYVEKDLSQVIFITFHVRGDLDYSIIGKSIALGRDLLIIPEPYPDGVKKIAQVLLSLNCNPTLTVMEKLTFSDEKIYTVTAEQVVNDDLKFSDLVIVHVPSCLRNS